MSASRIERTWEHAGLDCAVLVMDMGHRCGYVRVPDDHPWHGLGYTDEVPNPAETLTEDTPVEDAMEAFGVITVFAAAVGGNLAERSARLELQVRVHGGVTYAGHGCGDLPEGWWFGFDCAHAGDAPDLAEATPVHREIHAGWHDPSEHVWTLEEVAAETERMAEQIAAVPA